MALSSNGYWAAEPQRISWALASIPLHPLTLRICFHLLLASTSCLPANSATFRQQCDQQTVSYPGGAFTVVRSVWSQGQATTAKNAKRPAELQAQPPFILLEPRLSPSSASAVSMCSQPAMPLQRRGREEGPLPLTCVSSPVPSRCSRWLSSECSGL